MPLRGETRGALYHSTCLMTISLLSLLVKYTSLSLFSSLSLFYLVFLPLPSQRRDTNLTNRQPTCGSYSNSETEVLSSWIVQVLPLAEFKIFRNKHLKASPWPNTAMDKLDLSLYFSARSLILVSMYSTIRSSTSR